MGLLWQGAASCTHQPTHPPTHGGLDGSTGRESHKCSISGVKFQRARESLPFHRTRKRMGLTRSRFLTVSEAKACLAGVI